ncbi:AAA family ATPase [Jeongeupia wiesaeckerbachi]|uniref:AAA family ATPase n=1 Tax=Jeongeupia wiesaeckerbachi TaxID=3051218 RepID=UPI003D804FF0
MLTTLAIANYRSLRQLILPLGRLNVITGANGSGKSNLYRALRLLAETAQGRVIPSLAREGGLPSTLWAGPETISRAMRRGEAVVQGTVRNEPVHLRLGFASDDFGYAIDIGMPEPVPNTLFGLDPEIKRECLWAGPILRPAAVLADRHGPLVKVRDNRDWRVLTRNIAGFDSMMLQCADPVLAPEVLRLREQMRSWRFYDHFRTDADAPARQTQIGTRTPVLGHDGSDLAAALQTIIEIGDEDALHTAIDDAFPGSQIHIPPERGRFSIQMRQHGLLRPLSSAELSDGTLRYLLLVAALLTPRPPALLVLNEPETSLHPDLLPALARLIQRAARDTQVIVVSHAARLIAALERHGDCNSLMLEKDFGETQITGLEDLARPPWQWATR